MIPGSISVTDLYDYGAIGGEQETGAHRPKFIMH
jgi:hypothetical protein